MSRGMAKLDGPRRASIARPPGEDEREADGGEDAADVGHRSWQGAFAVLDRSSAHKRDSAIGSDIHARDSCSRGNERRRLRRLPPLSIQVSNSRRHAPGRTKASAIAPVVCRARGEPVSLFPRPTGGVPPNNGGWSAGRAPGAWRKPPWGGIDVPAPRAWRGRAPAWRSGLRPPGAPPSSRRGSRQFDARRALSARRPWVPRGRRPRDDARCLTEAGG